jgi:hypothetical protein
MARRKTKPRVTKVSQAPKPKTWAKLFDVDGYQVLVVHDSQGDDLDVPTMTVTIDMGNVRIGLKQSAVDASNETAAAFYDSFMGIGPDHARAQLEFFRQSFGDLETVQDEDQAYLHGLSEDDL